MKKYLLIAAAALVATALVSCNPDNEAGGGGNQETIPEFITTDATNVCINEWNGNTNYKGIELFNPTGAAVTLEGWTIIKNDEVPPTEGAPYWTGTATDIIPAGGYLVIRASKGTTSLDGLPATTLAINKGTGGLSASKAVKLVLKNNAGTVMDTFDRNFTPEELGMATIEGSAARVQDGKALWKVMDPTFGATNNGAAQHGNIDTKPTPVE